MHFTRTPKRFLALALLCSTLLTACAGGSGEALMPPTGKVSAGKGGIGTSLALTEEARRALSGGESSAVRNGVLLAKKGKIADALSVADHIGSAQGKAAIEWASFRSGGKSIAYERYANFLQTQPNWPSTPWVKRRAEDALWRGSHSAQTIFGHFNGNTPLSSEGHLALAKAKIETGDKSGAVSHIQTAYLSSKLDDDDEKLLIDQYGSVIGRDTHAKRAQILALNEKFSAANRAAARAGGDYVRLVNAAERIADKRAGQEALSGVSSSLSSEPLYIFAKAQGLRRNEKLQEAAQVFAQSSKALDMEEVGDAFWIERRVLTRALMRVKDFSTAYEVSAGHRGGSAQNQMDAQFHAGWLALRFLKNPSAASKHFAALSEQAETPISKSRGYYWQARAAEAGGSGSSQDYYGKAAQYKTSYYGQLAAQKTGQASLSLKSASASSSLASEAAVYAIKTYYEMDEDQYARPLIYDYAYKLNSSSDLEYVVALARKSGDAKTELSVAKLAMQRGFDLENSAYPTHAMPNYEKVSYSVERPVAMAIARQESLFDPKARSHANALGLMQMLPATARSTANRAGITFIPGQLYDAKYNSTLGAAHLGELMEKFNGSYIMTFAAYNAGAHRVKEWVELYGDPRDPNVDAIDWVEAIPFSETRNYVQRVMENMQVYNVKIGGKSGVTIAQDIKAGRPSAMAQSE